MKYKIIFQNIGFFRKGWNFVGEDGSVMQTNAGGFLKNCRVVVFLLKLAVCV